MSDYPGKYFVIDGADGCGKTTQVNLLEDHLKDKGYDVISIREPGGTEIGEQIREVLRNPSNSRMTPITEFFLLSAARSQLIHEVVIPALKKGKIVLSDRCKFSTEAYQGEAGGMGLAPVKYTADYLFSEYNLKIDGGVIVLPDDSELEALLEEEKHIDRYHQKAIEFHLKVNKAYRRIAKENGLEIIRYIKGEKGKEIEAIMRMQQPMRAYFDSLLIN